MIFVRFCRILGLYTTAVIVISQMTRRAVTDMAPRIMFDDLPYVDRILRLCLDIYLVRESGELSLEEDLFAKLIFLYRSPETMIRLLLNQIINYIKKKCVIEFSGRDITKANFCSGGQDLPRKGRELITKIKMTRMRMLRYLAKYLGNKLSNVYKDINVTNETIFGLFFGQELLLSQRF